MDYFAWPRHFDGSTHVCVLDREGEVVRESKTVSTARAIARRVGKPPPGVDAFGRLRSLRARSALDGVSWVQGG